MNRAERRKQGIYQPPPKMKHISEKDFRQEIDKAYRKGWDNAFNKACDIAVLYMFGISVIVLNDHFSEIRLKEFEGTPRAEHFYDLCEQTFSRYNDNDRTLSRLLNDVEKKTGFDISKRVFEEREDKQ